MANGVARFPEIAAASVLTPPAGKVFIFVDSADKHLKTKNDAGAVSDLAVGTPDFDSITDPAVDAAVTQAVIDTKTGTVITTTTTGNNQTLADPTDTTAGRLFVVINDDASTDTVLVNGVLLSPGNLKSLYWDGTAWTSPVAVGLPGGADSEIQFNDGGILAGDPNHTWDKTAKREKVVGALEQVPGEVGKLYTPTIVSTTATGNNPRRSVSLGNYLYVVDDTSDDLKIFDVTEPASPAQVGSLGGLGNCRGVDIVGDLVFVSSDDGAGFLHIVRVADKANPVLVSTTTVGGTPRGVKVVGPTAFVTGQSASQGLTSVDITNVNSPVVLDTLTTASSAIRTEFDVVGGIAYLVSSSGADSFFIVDVSDPSNLITLTKLNLDQDNWAVKTVGRYAYVVSQGSADLAVYDVSDPANTSATPVGSVSLGVGASPRALDVRGKFAYVVDAALDQLLVVNVSVPSAPVLVSNPLAIGAQSVSISTVGNFAYITDVEDNNFLVVDVGGVDAQNLNVGNIDAGEVNVRGGVKVAGGVNANSVVAGSAGMFSDGPVRAEGRRLGGASENLVEIFTEDDFPESGGIITPAPGVTYLIMQPLTLTKKIAIPVTVSGFDPAVIRTNAKYGNIVTVNIASGAMIEDSVNLGQLSLENIRFESDGNAAFANVVGVNQEAQVLLDLCDFVSFADGTVFDKCILVFKNGTFWAESGTITCIDAAVIGTDSFNINFGDSGKPAFDVQSSDPTATLESLFSVSTQLLSSFPGESFFRLHPNLIAGSDIRLSRIQHARGTPQTASFFSTDTGSITALADSTVNPGVKTKLTAAGHVVAEGDTVTLSNFVTQTQYNGDFVATNVVAGVSFDVAVVFVATDTGNWTLNSLTQKDPKVTGLNNERIADSKAIGSFYVNDNASVTVIAAEDTFTDLNLGTVIASSNIERWELTDAVTGELTYTGVEPFAGVLVAAFTVKKVGQNRKFNFRVVKNGAVLADAVQLALDVATEPLCCPMVVPITAVNGDTIRMQAENTEDADDITFTNVSVNIQ